MRSESLPLEDGSGFAKSGWLATGDASRSKTFSANPESMAASSEP